MKLKYEFKTMEIVDELVAVPTGDSALEFRGAIQLNGVAADILEQLKNDTTEEQVIEALLKEYDASREDIAESVHRTVETLRAEGMLEE